MARLWKQWSRRLREARLVAKGAISTSHPVMAHIIPIRRCNLSCAYCNEYDDVSQPVPTDVMLRRINHLGDLGTTIVTFSGGEPILHPDLDDLIAQVRKRGMLAGLITNGYLLVPDRIARLNRAGLDWLQISIDNLLKQYGQFTAKPSGTGKSQAQNPVIGFVDAIEKAAMPTSEAMMMVPVLPPTLAAGKCSRTMMA